LKKGPTVDESRRSFLRLLGKGSVVAAFLGQIAAAARAFVPNVLYEPLKRFKILPPDQYPQGYTFDPEHRLFVVRAVDDFHVISAICTHLGCTVQWRDSEFDCPCHGSRFAPDGQVLSGPAPRPLEFFAVDRAPDGRLEVDSGSEVSAAFRFKPAGSKA
jgi:cytochrome b6-f complex iron-sulfur subunit